MSLVIPHDYKPRPSRNPLTAEEITYIRGPHVALRSASLALSILLLLGVTFFEPISRLLPSWSGHFWLLHAVLAVACAVTTTVFLALAIPAARRILAVMRDREAKAIQAALEAIEKEHKWH